MLQTKCIKVILIGSVMALASCASSPEKIPASVISSDSYLVKECVNLNNDLENAKNELEKVSSKQKSTANKDAWLIILSIVPLSKVTGDYAEEVAHWKGEVNAIEAAQAKKKCS